MATNSQITDASTAAVSVVAAKATNYGATVAVVSSGFFAENWIGITGIIIALAGFAVRWYYDHQNFKLRQAKTEAQVDVLREIRGKSNDDPLDTKNTNT